MYSTKLSLRNKPFLKDLFDVKPHSLYLKFERKLYHDSFLKVNCLETYLKSQRVKFDMSGTHLAMILNCSRPQYFRMERGENRFKDEQLEVLASLYGEDVSTYKDMQDMDYLLKKIGYNDNPERAIYLLELVLKAIKKPLSHNSQREDSSSSIHRPIFSFNPISKEIQHQKLVEIIENIRLRYQQNDLKMAEIREKIVPMADATNPTKAKLWQQFHLLEDEQISMDRLINKMNNLLSEISKPN